MEALRTGFEDGRYRRAEPVRAASVGIPKLGSRATQILVSVIPAAEAGIQAYCRPRESAEPSEQRWIPACEGTTDAGSTSAHALNIALIPRTACRMRFSFSISAKRTCVSP